VHGGQELALFNAHHDNHCFLTIHIHEAGSGKPVAIFLRSGRTPDGAEVACVLRHVIRHFRARWPRVQLLIRGDSHYGRIAAIQVCERLRVGYIFGLGGNRVMLRKVADLAEDVALRRLEAAGEKVRRHGEIDYAAKSWPARPTGIATDTRFIITNLAGTPEQRSEEIYCARGNAETLIKAHKRHLASDWTSCSKATANQFRLLIRTAAYRLMLGLHRLAPKLSFRRDAQFDTIRFGPASRWRSHPAIPKRRAGCSSSRAPPSNRRERWVRLPPVEPNQLQPLRRQFSPARAVRATLAHGRPSVA
jgi:hypothetical protein